MDAPNEDARSQTPLVLQGLICVGALGIMVAGMYYSITYPYPSGKPLDVAGFVALWLREIVIVAFAAVVAVVLVAAWLVRLVRRVRARGKNAL